MILRLEKLDAETSMTGRKGSVIPNPALNQVQGLRFRNLNVKLLIAFGLKSF